MIAYLAIRIAVALARLTPLRLAYAVARLAGALAFVGWTGGRRRCVRNMLRVTAGDPRAAWRLARASFGNYAIYLVDFFRFIGTEADEVRRRVIYDGWPTLESLRQGRGIVFVTMHYGNWDLGAAALALNGFPISALADTFPNRRVNDLVIGSRTHLGMKIIPAERMGPGILRALRGNEVIALLIDVPQADGGVEVSFFGDTIAVPDGPARIALRAGSSVVAAVLPRSDRWSDRVHARVLPVAFTPVGDTEQDVRGLTQAIMSSLETLVREDPSQWYIFRALWVADTAHGSRAPRPAVAVHG